MRYFLWVTFLYFWVGPGFSQGGAVKPVIDSAAIADWQSVSTPAISNDGKYFLYVLNDKESNGGVLVVRSVLGGQEQRFTGISKGFFSEDSRRAVLQQNDTLFFLDLASGGISKLTVGAIRQPQANNGRWLGYQLKNKPGELVLFDLVSGREQRFFSVKGFEFSKTGASLVVKIDVSRDSGLAQGLVWVNLSSGRKDTIWASKSGLQPSRIVSFRFDEEGRQLVIIIEDVKDKQLSRSLWYYREGMALAELRIDERTPGIGNGVSISNGSFSSDGRWIELRLDSLLAIPQPSADLVKLNVWSYKDRILQPEQLRLFEQVNKSSVKSSQIIALMAVNGKGVIRPMHDSLYFHGVICFNGDYMVVRAGGEKDIERWWPWSSQPSVYVLNLKDGALHLLQKQGMYNLSSFSFSPGGDWLVYYDRKRGAYYSYELSTGKIRNMTANVPTVFRSDYEGDVLPGPVAPIIGWLAEDKSVLLYDNYDVWRVDPLGRTRAVNVTNGYGKKHHIKLRLLNGPESRRSKDVFKPGEELLLIAFSCQSKQNGFYNKVLGTAGDPEKRYMGPYSFYRTGSQAYGFTFDGDTEPLQAGTNKIWVVKRQSTTEAPNYYLTEDFRSFKPLTNVQPQVRYNWLKAELISWKQLDGSLSQGVLYKPEDFNPKKKYSVLFNYYEQLSHRLYEFPEPGFTKDNINIPWYVSRGYLVCTPDIHYKVGAVSGKSVGEWAYNSVVSAARYLSALPYVDGARMGIQGHSFGGGETNYLVTHTGIFAAAAEVAGNSDPISAYLTLVPFLVSEEHYTKQSGFEDSHDLYGATPWERPDLYRKNSAVLNADKVTTPLLIMHNKIDNQIQWRQGIELYMAMRRLGKRCWMLQYDRGNHGVTGPSAVDYTIRLTQFFDHYLKGALPPKWMTLGVPAANKGIDSGLELDSSGAMP